MKSIETILKSLTLEQKARLLSGADNWHTYATDDVPEIMMSDGPHGLRTRLKDENGNYYSVKSVCFPPACATACSFDTALLRRMGTALAEECHAQGVDILLGPGINIKRSPLGGRNFEYFSEDPYLTAELGSAFVGGVQEEGVGTSVKHYALNNQEYLRRTTSSEADERTMREIYLYPFEKIVKKTQPYTVMASYNLVNGTYATQHKWLLDTLLRDEWGYKGAVISDWVSLSDMADAVNGGLDIEMPYTSERSYRQIMAALQSGKLNEEVLDSRVRRVLELVTKCVEGRRKAIWDYERDHALAKQICDNCAVLLKNENHILPLDKSDKVALIGAFAETPRFQGGGSSNANAFKITKLTDLMADAPYAPGYRIDSDEPDTALIADAVALARSVEKIVLVIGLPDGYESEGQDRTHLHLPPAHTELLHAVSAVNPNVIAVLQNGSPIEMPWLEKAKAVLEMYLGGQAVSESIFDLLYGNVNPSGRLAESFPLRLQDTPCYLDYFGHQGKTYYREGVFVGYRYYDKKEMPVLFPFGFGLSYTEFAYSDLHLSSEKLQKGKPLIVSVTVTNVGNRSGKEVVQLYIADKTDYALRPIRELKAFSKVELAPGERTQVLFALDESAFCYFDEDKHAFFAPGGTYAVEIGKSSREIVLAEDVKLISNEISPMVATVNSSFAELIRHPKTHDAAEKLLTEFFECRYPDHPTGHSVPVEPLRTSFFKAGWDADKMEAALKELNS